METTHTRSRSTDANAGVHARCVAAVLAVGERRARVRSILAARAVLTLAALFGICANAGAQTWQKVFGDWRVQGAQAIAQTLDGGFAIAAIDEFDAGVDFYLNVLRTDERGNELWDRQFSVGPDGHGVATDIKQCANGDLMIVGYVVPTNFACTGCVHILAMRLDFNGDVVWQRVYGNTSSDQVALSVVETQLGNGGATNAGDFIIAGYAVVPNDESKGILIRVDADGRIIWQQLYDSDPATTLGNALESVDESRVGPGAGDIIACGEGIVPNQSLDMWVLRVDGATGLVDASPQASAMFGLVAHDWGNSIQELRAGPTPGDLVMSGGTYNSPYGGPPQTAIVQMPADPCDAASPIASRFYGDIHALERVGGHAVREITNPANGSAQGNVVMVGIMNKLTLGPNFGGFLQELQFGTLTNVGQCHIYGGTSNHDGLYALTESNPPAAPGFVAVGFASSSGIVPPGNASDIYLVQADPQLQSCIYNQTDIGNVPAGLVKTCLPAVITDPGYAPLCCLDLIPVDLQNDICNDGVPPKTNPGAGDAITSTAVLPLRVQVVPNPVVRGADVTIGFEMLFAADVTVTVADVSGKTVATRTMEHPPGIVRLPIATQGWAPGVYAVTVRVGTRTATNRFVVGDR